jgi:DNA-binding transcriptional LysR family regulator
MRLDLKSNDHIGSITDMNFAAFDLNLLRVFDALMRERSATRAGEQVGLSQPAVSAALNRLRDLLDDKLFVRQGNEMVPTPRAESIWPGIRDALSSLERLLASEKFFDPRSLVRSFTLMGADFFATLLVPRLINRFAEVSAGLSLRFLDTARGDVQRLLSDDAIDMALERPLEMPDWVSIEPLFTAPFKVIVARDNPLLKGLENEVTLPIDVFCALHWALRSSDGSMRGPVDEALEKTGRSRRVVLAVPHFATLVTCISCSRMAAAVPAQFAAAFATFSNLQVYDLPFITPAPDIKLYWHNRRTRDPAHAWLRKELVELCRPFKVDVQAAAF